MARMPEQVFKTANELEAWLGETHNVNSAFAEEAAPKLFRGGYVAPSSLEGISYDQLKRLEISDPIANSLRNQLRQQQNGE
jgi:hypothetical protein